HLGSLSGARRTQVDAENLVSHRVEETHAELTDETEPDHAYALTGRQLEAPNPLERHTADRPERRRFVRDAFRYASHEVLRDHRILGVRSEAHPHARHSIADGEGHPVVIHLDDVARAAVP